MSSAFERFFISGFLLLHPCLGFAQQFNFKNYSTKDGLGSSTVNHVFQDSKGYLWFSTQGGGASRFNGKKFKNFTKENGLINNDVTFITEDKMGNIWIGTSAGASKFDGEKFKSFSGKGGLPDGTVYSIYVDDNNQAWFASGTGGVYIYDGHKFDSLTSSDGLPSNTVFSIARDRNGYYWFTCSEGIAKYDGKQIIQFDPSEYGGKRSFFSTLADNGGNIWFGGTSGNGVVKYNGKTFESLILPEELREDFIGSIVQDSSGNIWFATDHGALKYNGISFSLFTEKEGLSVNAALSMTCDYQGNIWIGTQGGGVNFFNNEAFVNYTEKDGLSSRNVSCMVAGKEENLYYIGTPNAGLNIFKPDSVSSKFEALSGIKEIEGINIYTLTLDKAGLLWIGAHEGVFVLEKTRSSFLLEKMYTRIGDRDLSVAVKIVQDGKGNFWIATYGSGVFYISDEKQTYYSVENGFPSDNVLTIFEDSKSNIWIGTYDAGVIKYNGETFESFPEDGSFPDNSVWSITEDGMGNIYFGTGAGGLCCFDGKQLKTYAEADGIYSTFITVLQWDKYDDCLWLGTEKGVQKIKFKDGGIENIRVLSEQEGFRAFGINQNAILMDENGLVWFGSVNGLCRYNREYDSYFTSSPKMQLTGIRLAYQKVEWKNFTDSVIPNTNIPFDLKLSYKKNHLTFDVQALTTDDVEYTFKLEGQDEAWSPLTKNNEANYSNISPGGEYTFRAKAVNTLGSWSEETTPFTFTINPPWWNTWPFYFAVVFVLSGSIAGFIKGRERVLKEQNIRLEKTVKARTAELIAQKEAVTEEKKRSDNLLLNILPVEVAEELKAKGHADAKLFDNVTVLFSDFTSFTTLSERLTPRDLVDELHVCFREFDEIMARHSIEKIKTQGDAYLSVAGLPVANSRHAENVLKAAIEMRDFIINRKQKLGEKTFNIRIGVSSGSVVAGIVGVKKFAYDIWGDTVNVASRMEQTSLPGKINISETTYRLVKDKFKCVHRGKVQAKNKGEIDMYFVEAGV